MLTPWLVSDGGGLPRVGVQGLAGKRYRPESTDAPKGRPWQKLGPVLMSADAGAIEFTPPPRAYRVSRLLEDP